MSNNVRAPPPQKKVMFKILFREEKKERGRCKKMLEWKDPDPPFSRRHTESKSLPVLFVRNPELVKRLLQTKPVQHQPGQTWQEIHPGNSPQAIPTVPPPPRPRPDLEQCRATGRKHPALGFSLGREGDWIVCPASDFAGWLPEDLVSILPESKHWQERHWFGNREQRQRFGLAHTHWSQTLSCPSARSQWEKTCNSLLLRGKGKVGVWGQWFFLLGRLPKGMVSVSPAVCYHANELENSMRSETSPS